MPNDFEYVFPSIRGIQARREYFITMCPLRLIPKIFTFDDEELRPDMRAQRMLNKNRIPEMSRYMTDNRDNYVFSALTASIDADIRFEPLGKDGDEEERIGLLHIPMDAKFIINDGQHRRAAIEMALKEDADLADETIAIVLFLDKGLDKCQQMFADLNRYAIRPSKSLGVLYDYRDAGAKLTKLVVLKSKLFCKVVEMEKSSLSTRSQKLFTLSALYSANRELLANRNGKSMEDLADIAINFWEEISKHIPEWKKVREGNLKSGDVRSEYIHSHGVALQAMGKLGNAILKNKKGWKQKLKNIRKIDWSRSNTQLWEGRALSGGNVSNSGNHVTLTNNLIKQKLKIGLQPEEQRIEDAFLRGRNGKN